MINGKELAEGQLRKIIGLKPTRVKLGVGSFLTLDFGKDIPTEIKTKSGIRTTYFGEWYLWVYMCSWRIDKNGVPLVGSSDQREKIEKYIHELETRNLLDVKILNNAFDVELQFGSDIKLHLFSTHTEEHKQWMFYTPDEKVFVAGPSTMWEHKNSS